MFESLLTSTEDEVLPKKQRWSFSEKADLDSTRDMVVLPKEKYLEMEENINKTEDDKTSEVSQSSVQAVKICKFHGEFQVLNC